MNNENPIKDRRKFVRVITKARQGQLEPIEQLSLTWESGEEAAIFDISYGGVACSAPSKENIKTGDTKSFVVAFPNSTPVKMAAEVAWVNDEFVGLNFEPLSVEARSSLNSFLDAKILGLSLRLIDQQFYAPNMTCQYWYQGDFGVNLYLWEDKGQVTKGEVEFDNSIVSFNQGAIEWSRNLEDLKDLELAKGPIVNKAIDILGQVAVKEANVQDFLRHVLDTAKRS